MIVLDATTKSLEFKLGGAVSANQLVCSASWADKAAELFTPGHTDVVSNNTTAVTIVAAPAASTQRMVKSFTIFNDDTAAATVIVQYNNNATIRQITEISVPANGTLVYTDGEGFRVIDSSGQILMSVPDATRSNVAETITAGWAFTSEIDAQAGIDISGGVLKIGGTEIVSAGRVLSNITNIAQQIGVNKTSPTAQLHVVSGAADRVGVKVDTAASASVSTQQWFFDGELRADITLLSNQSQFVFKSFDNGSGEGPFIQVQRNANVSTPAAGFFRMPDKGNTPYFIWVDDSGNARIHTSTPTNANDGAGDVIGDQSSWHEAKDILGPALPVEDAVRSVAALVFDEFSYKETGYNTWDGSPPTFNGLVIRDRKNDWWGKNMGPHQIPSLNEIELFGRYGLTIQKLIEEVQALGGFAWL